MNAVRRSWAPAVGHPREPLCSGPMRALVVLPTYQEAENIETVLGRIREAAPEAEILVVDDGSPDGTADLAEGTGERLGQVSVLRRTEKSGLGPAYRAGFTWGLERELRRPRRDGRRPSSTTRRCSRGCSTPSTARPTWPSARATSPAAPSPAGRRPGGCCRSGATATSGSCSHAGPRRHRRVPRLPVGDHREDRPRAGAGRRLRLPDRDGLRGQQGGRGDRRAADHLPRPHPGHLEDGAEHRRRGHVARDEVGHARPGPARARLRSRA